MRRTCRILVLIVSMLPVLPQTIGAAECVNQQDRYIGEDWWMRVCFEDVPWLNGMFTADGFDRWGQPFFLSGNRLELGRGPTLAVFYVTGSTRLTLPGRNFGSNFYPVPASPTPVLDGGSIGVEADDQNRVALVVRDCPSLGELGTRITFDGVDKAFVANALQAEITSSYQDDGASEIMKGVYIDGRAYAVPATSDRIEVPFTARRAFGIIGGGTNDAPSLAVLLTPAGRLAGVFVKDPSTSPADDNVRMRLNAVPASYTVIAK